MRRFLMALAAAGALMLGFTAAPAFAAASHLYISEYTAPANSRGLIVQVAQEQGHDQTPVDFSGGVASSAVFQTSTNLIRVKCSAACSIAFGASPTATANNHPLSAGETEYLAVQPGAGWQVSVISNPDF